MSQNEFSDHLLPAWSRRRRIIATALLAMFIVLSSSFIGIGLFQSRYGKDFRHQPLNKSAVMDLLAKDTEFLRTVTQKAQEKECRNETLGLAMVYRNPLRPAQLQGQEACLFFSTIHPTGATTTVTVAPSPESREAIVAKEAKLFSYANTELLWFENTTISRISGVSKNTPTTIYVVDLKSERIIFRYTPTSPVIDGRVELLATSIYSFKPQ